MFINYKLTHLASELSDVPARVHWQLTRNFNTARGFAECGVENFEFIVRERVQVNPDNSRAVSALVFFYSNWIHGTKKHCIETTIYKVY